MAVNITGLLHEKLKMALTNDWSIGGTSLAAMSTAVVDKTEVFHWLPWLSQEVSYLLPIAGLVLLLVQIYFKLKYPKAD